VNSQYSNTLEIKKSRNNIGSTFIMIAKCLTIEISNGELMIWLTWNCMVILFMSWFDFLNWMSATEHRRLTDTYHKSVDPFYTIRVYTALGDSDAHRGPVNYHSAHNILVQLENGHRCQYYVNKWNIWRIVRCRCDLYSAV